MSVTQLTLAHQWQSLTHALNAALASTWGGTEKLPHCPACTQAAAEAQTKGDGSVVLASHVLGVEVAKVKHPTTGCPLQHLRVWAISWLAQTWLPPLQRQLDDITQARDTHRCKQTGACCELGSSPYPWETLQAMAQAGDTFAQQFTSVFLPYPSLATVQAKHPHAVAEITARHGEGNVHFYYCAYLQSTKACGLWGSPQRPALCASYPETPQVYVAKHCAWRTWQETHLPLTNELLVSFALVSQLAQRLEASTQQPAPLP